MQIPLVGSSALAPAQARAATASRFAAIAGQAEQRFSVPEQAFALAPGLARTEVAKDWRQAESFAAMAIGELLQPMFETVHLSAGRFGGGAGEAAWKPIFVQAIAEGVAAQGGLGLTDTVFRQIVAEARRSGKPGPAAPAPAAPSGEQK